MADDDILSESLGLPDDDELRRRLGIPTPFRVAPPMAPPQSGGIPMPRLPQRQAMGDDEDNPPPQNVAPRQSQLPTNIAPAPMAPVSVNPHTAEIARLENTGSGVSQIHNPFLRGLARVGDVGASILAPRAAEFIPGTTMHHQQLIGEQEGLLNQDINREKEGAATAAEQSIVPMRQAETEHMKAETAALNEKPQKPENLAQEHSDAVMAAIKAGRDPQTDPTVQRIQDSITAIQPEHKAADNAEVQAEKAWLARPENAGKDQADAKKWYAGLAPQARQEFHITPPANSNAAANRDEKSYEFHVNRLNKLQDPVDQIVSRMSRLQSTLDQHNPQADALVGPELLTVMAGGQGSGLRMNEAEISRIVGGRSAWENLKASMQHWSTDPSSARSITPDQDKQIRALVTAVGQKLTAKQQALQEGHQSLLEATDTKQHRQILADTQKKLNDIDASGGQQFSYTDPKSNKTYTFKDQQSLDNFKKEAGIK